MREDVRGFDCLGEVKINKIDIDVKSYYSLNDEFSLEKFPDNTLYDKCGSVSLFDLKWDKSSVLNKHLDCLFKMTRYFFLMYNVHMLTKRFNIL